MEKQCLILGPQNAGKSLLIKRIQQYDSHKKENNVSIKDPLPPNTQPTTGTTLLTIDTPSGPLLLKEIGGKMAPLWAKSLGKADMILYVIDASNSSQLSVAVVLLMETLLNESTRDKPLLLFYNKTDLPSSLSIQEIKTITRVEDLQEKYKDMFNTVSGSCLTCTGLKDVIKWLQEKRLELTTI